MPRLPREAHFTLPPDWICEILSASTAGHDRLGKMPVYAAAGVSWATRRCAPCPSTPWRSTWGRCGQTRTSRRGDHSVQTSPVRVRRDHDPGRDRAGARTRTLRSQRQTAVNASHALAADRFAFTVPPPPPSATTYWPFAAFNAQSDPFGWRSRTKVSQTLRTRRSAFTSRPPPPSATT
ncbi:uncharacterized protein CMC5_084940 [Chondromyces crocatus]|uniref:Putative restriction endonuclease domain-containing protein n=1 Tax=Chondromyces crocatus TaxID=52 RepID=A0A0K1EQR1_CHOCO|nr:uncharacterized protein CMC5_084940 [Chondromyces crocatus]